MIKAAVGLAHVLLRAVALELMKKGFYPNWLLRWWGGAW